MSFIFEKTDIQNKKKKYTDAVFANEQHKNIFILHIKCSSFPNKKRIVYLFS